MARKRVIDLEPGDEILRDPGFPDSPFYAGVVGTTVAVGDEADSFEIYSPKGYWFKRVSTYELEVA